MVESADSSWTIRALGPDDIAPIAALTTEGRRVYLAAIPRSEHDRFNRHNRITVIQHSLATYLADPGAVGFTVVHDGVIVGYVLGNDMKEIISYLFIAKRFRGVGLGSALLDAFLGRQSHAYRIEVVESNTGAIALYERYGFRRTGILPRSYFGLRKIAMERLAT